MKLAFLVGVEKVLLSSTDPHRHFIRPGTEHLLKWLNARGTVFLNTAMPAVTNSGELTLDCQTFLAEIGVSEGIRRWSFAEISKGVSLRNIHGRDLDPRYDVARKTTGYLALAQRDYTIVHIDVPPRPEERMDIESCMGKIVEVPAWNIRSEIIKDANTFRDRAETGDALELGYIQLAKSLEEEGKPGLVIVHPEGCITRIPTSGVVTAEEILNDITDLLEKARKNNTIPSGRIKEKEEYRDLESWFLRKIWFIPSDVPMRDASVLKRIDEIVIPKIEAVFDGDELRKSSSPASLNWNTGPEEIVKNVEGRDYIEEPFGGFPLGEHQEE